MAYGRNAPFLSTPYYFERLATNLPSAVKNKKISASNPSYKNQEIQRAHKYIRIYLYSIVAIVKLKTKNLS